MDEPALMTAREVCTLLHISKSTLATWREAGDVVAHPLPRGGWRYPSDQPVITTALAALGRTPAQVTS